MATYMPSNYLMLKSLITNTYRKKYQAKVLKKCIDKYTKYYIEKYLLMLKYKVLDYRLLSVYLFSHMDLHI